MFNTMIKAAENFCIHQVRMAHTLETKPFDEKGIITYIDIKSNNSQYRVYAVYDLNFSQIVSTIFLEEEKSDEETLIDMALESTNLIIGSAKVIFQNNNEDNFTIATPHFVKIDKYIPNNEFKIISIENANMLMAIESIDG